MFGRKKQGDVARQLGIVYADDYTAELNRAFQSLGRPAEVEDVWKAHQLAATFACARVKASAPETPDGLLAMSERAMLEDMLPSVGISDPKPFYLLMIESAMDAVGTGDISQTTYFSIFVMTESTKD